MIERAKIALMKNPVIIIIGQSGCGKGTQMGLLQKTFNTLGFKNTTFIETGELFREKIKKLSPYFRKSIQEVQEAGKLQSPLYAEFFWKEKMLYAYTGGPIVIDGSPRSVHEAQAMIDFFHFEMKKDMIVFYLYIPDDIAKERILERNIKTSKEGVHVRTDTDTDQKIAEKLRYFNTDVFPSIDYLNKKPGSAVYTIDGLQNPVAIHEQIISLIGMHVRK